MNFFSTPDVDIKLNSVENDCQAESIQHWVEPMLNFFAQNSQASLNRCGDYGVPAANFRSWAETQRRLASRHSMIAVWLVSQIAKRISLNS
jgi:hypothetical protein